VAVRTWAEFIALDKMLVARMTNLARAYR